jgi:alpha-1,6-mannosyltransferase
MLLLAAGAATQASSVVPASVHRPPGWHYPHWLEGPLHRFGVTIHLATSPGRYQALYLGICACYVIVLLCAQRIGSRRLWAGIVLAHAAALLAPPLLSLDVFGYIDFARLGVVHGLDPYTATPAAAAHDPVFTYIGWPHVSTPYGPLFTLLSYAFVPLGVAGMLWSLKALAALASLAAVAIVWRAAERLGRSPSIAAAFLGLNPLLLVWAVGGAHNDTLLGLLVASGLMLALSGRELGAAGGLAASVGIKASAALALPFALLGARRRVEFALVALSVLIALAIGLVIGFGAHTTALIDTLRGQQQFVAVHSVPAEISRAFGDGRLSAGIRTGFTVAFAIALLAALLYAGRHAERWLEAYGWATLALLVCTAWLLPWYSLWALLPAALSENRRLRAATLVFCAYLVVSRLPLAKPVFG